MLLYQAPAAGCLPPALFALFWGGIFHFLILANLSLNPSLHSLLLSHPTAPIPCGSSPRCPEPLAHPQGSRCRRQRRKARQAAASRRQSRARAPSRMPRKAARLTASCSHRAPAGEKMEKGVQLWKGWSQGLAAGRGGHVGWPPPRCHCCLPARGALGQVPAPAAVLAVALLARGDAEEAGGPHVVQLVAFVAVQSAGEVVPQLRHRHWREVAWG